MSGILALIPARGGSKGIPRKNVRPIAGKPLIAWTIEAALACEALAAVVVSTEDEEIAEVARAAGAETPFRRPAALATDETPGIGPVQHALQALPHFDAVLLLQPTSPLRTAGDIDGLLQMVKAAGATSAVSVCEVGDHPAWMFSRSGDGRLHPFLSDPRPARRQDMEALVTLNGAMYYADRDQVLVRERLVAEDSLGYVMPVERSIDIDTPFDWHVAEMLLAGPVKGLP